MDNYYTVQLLSKEYRRISEEKANHFVLVRLAEQKIGPHGWSKLLVKLAGVFIQTGMKLKSYAEKDMNHHLPIASLQDM